jgi:hypothetical protein
MTLTPFRGRCHTCGHDHDAEETLARDVIELTRQADAERRREAAAVPVEVVQALNAARVALHAHDEWHREYDDFGGFPGSMLDDQTEEAQTKITVALSALATLQAAEPAAKKGTAA